MQPVLHSVKECLQGKQTNKFENFKRKTIRLMAVFFMLCLFTASQKTLAQATAGAYTFANSSAGSLTSDRYGNAIDMITGTTQLVAANQDNTASSVTTFPSSFAFTFAGTSFTQFSASSNGIIRLGATQVSSAITSIGQNGQFLIAPYAGDLETSATGKVHYKLVGTSPTRTFVIEFLNMGINKNSSTADGTFQVRFFETSNIIEFVYGTMNVGTGGNSATGSTTTVNIGIGNSNSSPNLLSVNQSSPYTTSTSGTAIANANTSVGAIAGLNSAADGFRRSFSFGRAYASRFVSSNTGATSWCAGETRNVTITIQNMGVLPWSDIAGTQDFNIGVKWNASGTCTGNPSPGNWCDYHVRTDAANLASGASTTYTLPLTASNYVTTPVAGYTTPLGAGTNNIIFDIVEESISWLGDNNGNTGPGNAKFTSANQTIVSSPTAVAGTAVSTCSNSGAVNITTGSSATNAATTTWTSSGTGTFANPTSLTTATYTPSSADITAGSVTLTLTSTPNSPCVGNATSNKTLTISQAPTATAGGSQTICQTGTATVSGATSSNGTIAWTENGAGSITSGATTLTPTYTPLAGDAGNTVTLTMTVSNSPCTAATATYTVIVNGSPTASAGGTSTICQNGTATVSGASSSNGTIAWTENGAGSITSGAATLTPTYTPLAGDAGNTVTLTMTVTSNNSCAPATATATYSVVVKGTPTATAGGSQTICQTGTATVSGATSSNGTIAWTENGAGSITSGATTLTPTYTPLAGDAGNTVTLTMTVSNSPCTAATATYTVIVNGSPAASAGGTSTICQNGTATVSGASSSNGTIAWTENGAGSITSGATTLTPTYTPLAGDAGNTVTLTMTVTSNNSCAPATATATYSVVVKGTPTATAGGSQTICQTGTATVSGATSSNGTIAWTENGAGSITSGATTLTPTYTPLAGDAGNTVTLTMTVSNSPCTAATATYTVIVNASATAAAGTAIVTCANSGAVNITAGSTASNNAGVTWTSNGTGTFTNANSLTLATYDPSPADIAAGSRTLTLTATGSTGCVNATSNKTFTINPVPVTTGVAICQGGSGSLASSTTCSSIPGTVTGTNTNTFTLINNSNNNISLPVTGVPAGATITDVNLSITIAHNYQSDVVLALSTPGGATTVSLTGSSPADNSNNLGNTTSTITQTSTGAVATYIFDQSASTVAWGSNNPASAGSYRPAGSGTLNTFIGLTTINGSWNLNAKDIFNNDNGLITSVTVTVQYTMPGTIQWYTASSGGTSFGSGSPFNPVGVTNSGLPNTNTPGTTTFYAECSSVAGCRTPTTFVINALPTISSAAKTSYNGSDLSCSTSSDGQITVTASAVTGTLQYSKNNGGTYQASNVFSSLAAGTYQIVVKDANCNSATTSVTITAPTAVTISSAVKASYNGSDLSCSTSSDGQITVTAAGGTGTKQYSKDNGGTYQASNIFSGLGAGTYQIKVIDANNCLSAATSVTITAPSSVTISSAVKASYNGADLSCSTSSNGQITVTAAGGTGTKQYSKDNGGSYQASNIFSGLGAGTYLIVVKDANNCPSAATSVTITAPVSVTITSAVKASYNGSDLSCSTATDGQITVTATGGTGTKQYSKNNGGTYQASNIFSALAAGTYQIVVKDANNCLSAATSVTITAPAGVTISSTVKTSYNGSDLSCSTSSDGEITVTAVGGSGTLQYSKNNGGTYQSSNVFSSLIAGTYQIKVKDANNCLSTTTSVTITAPAGVTISSAVKTSYNGSDLTCSTSSDGEITVIAIGGTSTLQYSDDNGNTYQLGNVFSGLPAGTYQIVVKDANNCLSAVTFVTITAPSAIAASETHVNVNCNGNSTGSIALTASGGTSSYTYTVTGVGTNSTGSFPGLVAGTYSYSITDANNCSPATGSIIITEPATALNGSITSQTNVSCSGGSNGSVTVAGSGGTAGYTYSKDGTTFQASGTFSGLTAGSYTITIKDANGCSTTVPAIITSATAVTGTLTGSATICVGNSTNLNIAVTGSGTITGTLSDGTTFSGMAPNIVVSVSPTTTTTYTIATITNGTCAGSGTGSATITINANTWTGVTSTDWNVTTNWSCNVVPNSSLSDIIISDVSGGSGNNPVISATQTVRNITIASGASVTTTSAGTLTISGTYSNAGTLANNGTIILNGTSLQNFPGSNATVTAMNALEVNNAAGISIDQSFTLSGVLTPTAGTINLGNNFITLKSDVNNTARVGVVGGGFNYNNGRFIVQRYFNSTRSWRLMTAPVTESNTIFDGWQLGGLNTTTTPAVAGQGEYVTGPGATGVNGNGLDAGVSGNYSLKTYNSSTGALVGVGNTKVAVSPGFAGSTASNIGYFNFVRGDRTPSNIDPNTTNTNITTLSSTGKLQTGSYTFPAVPTHDKYTLIGNPYASPVYFPAISRSNVQRRFYAWDPQINQVGAYVVVDDPNNTGTWSYSIDPSLTSQRLDIQSGQAIYIQTINDGPALLTFDESNKSTNDVGLLFRPLQPSGAITSFRTNLFLLNADNSTAVADGVFAQFSTDFSNAVDLQDGIKFPNVNETFSLIRNGALLSLERRQPITMSDTLFFNLTKSSQRNYQFQFKTDGLYQAGVSAFLEDTYLKTSTLIDISATSTINFSITSDAASQVATRFRIVFKPSAGGPLPVTFTSVKAFQQNNAINVEWKVENEMNMKEYQVEKSADGIHFNKAVIIKATGNNSSTANYQWPDANPVAGNNYYRISSVDVNGRIQNSNIVKVFIGKGKSDLIVYPNPITNGNINLQLINQPKGTYSIRLMNKLGQIILQKQIEHEEGSSTETMQMSKNMAHGTYQLEITKPDSNKTNINVLY